MLSGCFETAIGGSFNDNTQAGYKRPKLEELHLLLFDEDFDNAHDALADTEACMRCFFELVERGVISIS